MSCRQASERQRFRERTGMAGSSMKIAWFREVDDVHSTCRFRTSTNRNSKSDAWETAARFGGELDSCWIAFSASAIGAAALRNSHFMCLRGMSPPDATPALEIPSDGQDPRLTLDFAD